MCRLLLKTKIGKEDKLFETALKTMVKGGPDATHILTEDDIAFGHNRLSIIDLRSVADQPMMIDGNIILFNGEIYNYKTLKAQHNLITKSDSDTEVILALYNMYGDAAFDLLDGEFAIVIYDPEEEEIKVVRDRLGVKQLYYSNEGDELIVSSEIKGILPFIGDPVMDSNGFDQWCCYGYTVGEQTMFEKVSKVLPNVVMTFDKDGDIKTSRELDELDYDKKNANESLSMTIARSVAKRMIADVPVSCTLSGGIDSSIVAYLMGMLSSKPIKTYTIGFEGCDNEFEQARKVSELVKSEHTQVEIPFSRIMEELDEILETIEEPIDKGSLIPTYFLAKSIKEKVTLIGEGADEVFAGYSRHKWIKDNPDKDFEEYFDSQLRVFINDEVPIMTDDWDDKNSALKFDIETEIPNFHTIRIDKCMMHNGIEARVPFLDPEVTSSLYEVPYDRKQSPEKKYLREAFKDLLPEWVVNQPKKALKLPFEKIIRLPEVEKLIRKGHDLFDNALIIELYTKLEMKQKNAARDLWNIFLFKKWENKYLK